MKKWLSILGILAILATMVLATFRPQLRYFMAQLTAELHRRLAAQFGADYPAQPQQTGSYSLTLSNLDQNTKYYYDVRSSRH